MITGPKILAINGSHHGDHGYTRFLIDLLFEGARSAGSECEVVSLANLTLNRCLGCDCCQKNVLRPVNQDEFTPHCIWDGKDDGQMIFSKLAAADLLIYATPVHVFSMTGMMKNFFDRIYGYGNSHDLCLSGSGMMFHFVDHRVVSKPFLSIVNCSNFENETPANIVSYFRTFSRFMDAPIVGMLVRNGSAMAGKGNDPVAEERFPRIKNVYAAYRRAGEELGRFGKIKKSTESQANQEIVPVPFFNLLKRITNRRLKMKFLDRARQFIVSSDDSYPSCREAG